MGKYERSIKIAFDKMSGEILEADDIFDEKVDAFAVRKRFHRDEIELFCCECNQKLNVSTSKYDRLHFKHQPKHEFCILTDGDLSPKQLEEFSAILRAKESPRHKELKNKIAERLIKVEGIDLLTIAIDNKFIIRGGEKRRPDVYCRYFNKDLVFEIQLSDLSLRYILDRYEFYKKNNMYLIWILDNFDVHHQGQLERDIKYLTEHQNFFKLDENSEEFMLDCTYKFSFLTDDNRVLTKWVNKSVNLNKVSFDSDCYQIYYYNFTENKIKVENRLDRILQKKNELERKVQEQRRLSKAKDKSDYIIQEIRDFRNRKSQNFDAVIDLIEDLDEYEFQYFNQRLDLNNPKKKSNPALIQWIDKAEQMDVAFIEFILNCLKVELDVNAKDIDGKTAFQVLIGNEAITDQRIFKSLIRRGYNLTTEDEVCFKTIKGDTTETKEEWLLLTLCNRLTNRLLTDSVFDYRKLLFIIESSRSKKIIGFNYKTHEWIAFANNAIHHHKEYWEYIEMVFKQTGLWDTLIQADKKGIFQRKIRDFYLEIPQQKFDFDELFKDLYSELID